MYGWITGRASSPKYLWIDNENIELKDASGLWGKTTWETTDILQKRHGKQISVAGIGQAGENRRLWHTYWYDVLASGLQKF